MPYRNNNSAGKDAVVTYVFATAPIPLQSGKQVASLTLPATVNGGDIHLYALSTM
jgi:hypothetical protein